MTYSAKNTPIRPLGTANRILPYCLLMFVPLSRLQYVDEVQAGGVGLLATMDIEEKAVDPALEDIYQAHHRHVFKAAYKLLGNSEDAEDVLQTVFLRLARRHGDAAVMKSVESYLYRAAVNAALDLLRSRRDKPDVSLDQDEMTGNLAVAARSNPENDIDLKRWIRQALPKLTGRSAEMFVLRYVQDFGNREIASMFQTSQAVVAVTLFRTRTQLQKDFKAYMRGTR
jgi:RNA polymerase sigma-70 factor, ECF subfamily